jgi:hypothetical protein
MFSLLSIIDISYIRYRWHNQSDHPFHYIEMFNILLLINCHFPYVTTNFRGNTKCQMSPFYHTFIRSLSIFSIIKSYIIQINYNIFRLLSNSVTQFSRVWVVKIRVCWSSFNLYCMWAVGWVRSNRLFEYDLWSIEKK